MPEMDDGVVSILGHGTTRAGFRTMFCDERTGGSVLVFEESGVPLSRGCDLGWERSGARGALTTLASNQ